MTEEELRHILTEYLKQAEIADEKEILSEEYRLQDIVKSIKFFGRQHPKFDTFKCYFLETTLMVTGYEFTRTTLRFERVTANQGAIYYSKILSVHGKDWP